MIERCVDIGSRVGSSREVLVSEPGAAGDRVIGPSRQGWGPR